jgi:protein-S-isoprenylcysteine O-methyltransferase Ste14
MAGRDETAAGRPLSAQIIGGTVGIAAFAGVLLGSAGRLDWWRGWSYVALVTVVQSASGLYLNRRDPEMIRRRGRPGKGTERWDVAVLALFGLGYFAAVIVAALDSGRFAWSAVPGWAWPLGAGLYVAGVAVGTWAMAVNTHFEKTVRIQHDRNHRVIDGGPYRLVRHPGYVGAALSFPIAAPLLLGSWWAFAPAALSVAALVLRTALEDRLLVRKLDGYAAYASRVPCRLIPGVW